MIINDIKSYILDEPNKEELISFKEVEIIDNSSYIWSLIIQNGILTVFNL